MKESISKICICIVLAILTETAFGLTLISRLMLEDHLLIGEPILTINVSLVTECQLLCARTKDKCLSFNVIELNSKHLQCELFNASWINPKHLEFKEAKKSSYYEIQLEESEIQFKESCLDYKNAGHTVSGIYNIRLGAHQQKVYCDMDTDGGGWTVF